MTRQRIKDKNEELTRAEDAKKGLEKEVSDLEKQNEKIRKEVAVSGLNEMQVRLVEENASDIDRNVRPEFKLDWRTIKFMLLLGSGTFGDCYKGSIGTQEVAVSGVLAAVCAIRRQHRTDTALYVCWQIKKMRAGLIDKDGFDSFSKEVVMLAQLDHENVVTFKGYCLKPALLIVMDFVAGGTLKAFVTSANEEGHPPRLQTVTKILEGCALALAYLHTMDPAPILHRDIKSENILLTEKLEPRIADLGEARTMAQNKTMTAVGTNGYTAPEV